MSPLKYRAKTLSGEEVKGWYIEGTTGGGDKRPMLILKGSSLTFGFEPTLINPDTLEPITEKGEDLESQLAEYKGWVESHCEHLIPCGMDDDLDCTCGLDKLLKGDNPTPKESKTTISEKSPKTTIQPTKEK